jgi:hypothetical protein
MTEDRVNITHPNLPTKPIVTVSRKAYKAVWKERGWRITMRKKEN